MVFLTAIEISPELPPGLLGSLVYLFHGKGLRRAINRSLAALAVLHHCVRGQSVGLTLFQSRAKHPNTKFSVRGDIG